MRASTGWAGVCAATLLVSGAEILAHGPLTRVDHSIESHYLYHSDSTSIDIASWLADIGQPWLACVIVGSLGLFFTLRSGRMGPVLAAGTGLGIVGLGTLILKNVFPHPSIYFGLPGSFPSGHTGVAVASAGIVVALLCIRHSRRDAIALALAGLWGMVMAWGRLVTLAHWFSDVVAGWSLGMIALVIALRVIDNHTSPREFVNGVLRRAGTLGDKRGSVQPTPGDR